MKGVSRPSACVWILLALAAAVACGGHDAGALAPAPTPERRPVFLSIQPAITWLWVGESRQLVASIVYSDGTIERATPRWTSSHAAAVVATSDGEVRAVGSGDTSVTASALSGRITLLVRSSSSWPPVPAPADPDVRLTLDASSFVKGY